MKLATKIASALVATAALASPAHAQVTEPGTGNGALLAAIWDGTRSIVTWLGGETYNSASSSILAPTTPGAVNRTYSVDLTGFNQAETRYMIVAADFGAPGVGYLSTGGRGPIEEFLAGVGAPPLLEDALSGLGGAVSQFAQAVQDFVQFQMNGTCSGAVTCVATSNSAPNYWGNGGVPYFGASAVPWDTSALAGTPLSFIGLTSADGATAELASEYTNGSRVGQWNLNFATGQITYNYPAAAGGTEVPLPAAAWLLLSGIAGLGAAARRRKSA